MFISRDNIEFSGVNPMGDIALALDPTPPMLTRLQLNNSMESNDFSTLYSHDYWSGGLQ